MYWDLNEIKYMGNRTFVVKFADGLSGTMRLAPSYCTGVFRPLLDDKLLEQASVRFGVCCDMAEWLGFGARYHVRRNSPKSSTPLRSWPAPEKMRTGPK
jgi:hypothetical protein